MLFCFIILFPSRQMTLQASFDLGGGNFCFYIEQKSVEYLVKGLFKGRAGLKTISLVIFGCFVIVFSLSTLVPP